jgi:hypothetical protein
MAGRASCPCSRTIIYSIARKRGRCSRRIECCRGNSRGAPRPAGASLVAPAAGRDRTNRRRYQSRSSRPGDRRTVGSVASRRVRRIGALLRSSPGELLPILVTPTDCRPSPVSYHKVRAQRNGDSRSLVWKRPPEGCSKHPQRAHGGVTSSPSSRKNCTPAREMINRSASCVTVTDPVIRTMTSSTLWVCIGLKPPAPWRCRMTETFAAPRLGVASAAMEFLLEVVIPSTAAFKIKFINCCLFRRVIGTGAQSCRVCYLFR